MRLSNVCSDRGVPVKSVPLARGVLGPGPPARLDRLRGGFLGASRAIFYERPWLAEKMARLLSQRTNSEAITRLVLDSVRGSSADAAALQDPAELDVLVRACRQCAQSMRGFLAEITARGAGAEAAALADGRAWTLVFGDQDAVFDQSTSMPFWHSAFSACKRCMRIEISAERCSFSSFSLL